jgi:hypothetical protein
MAAAAEPPEQAAIAFWQVFAGSSEELRQARASKKYPSVADKRESRKLMHNPLAPFGNIRYLVRNSDTILFQHDAAHGSESPLRS